ncbi:MAG: Ig-like domain-containing protein [Gammaproteobacteria bacterium]|nr:Ig-like domain-containing protein [Gammaproteobacteria bacterium]
MGCLKQRCFVLLVLLLLGACGTPINQQDLSLRILSISPENGRVDVAIDSKIIVNFSRQLIPSEENSFSVSLQAINSFGGFEQSAKLDVLVEVNTARTQFIITPYQHLSSDTFYRFMISSDVLDGQTQYGVEFQTLASNPLTIVNISPYNGQTSVDVGTQITVNLSRGLSVAESITFTSLLHEIKEFGGNVQQAAPVSIAVKLNETANQFIIEPVNALSADHVYHFIISSELLTDQTQHQVEFRTSAINPLRITQISPENGATAVPITSEIQIYFSRPVTNLEYQSFQYSYLNINNTGSDNVSFTPTLNQQKLTIASTAPLNLASTYRFSISSNIMEQTSHTIEFQTVVSNSGLEVVSITPENGSLHIPIVSDIFVLFNRPISETDIASFNIKIETVITDPTQVILPGTTHFGLNYTPGSSILVVQPQHPLEYDNEYLFSVDSSRFANKKQYSSKFLTYFNDISYYQRYKKNAETQLNEIEYYDRYFHDHQGRRTHRLRYHAAGNDGVWLNNDDSIFAAYRYDQDLRGMRTRVSTFQSPGVDGLWLNEDDIVHSYQSELYDLFGKLIGTGFFRAFGDDRKWFTSDDVMSSYDQRWIANPEEIRWARYDNPGLDSNWLQSEDNVVRHFSRHIYNNMHQKVRHIFYTNAGADLSPYTNDDEIGYYHVFYYNELQLRDREIWYTLPGDDNRWQTEDDIIAICHVYKYDHRHLVIGSTQYKPGLDQTCFTDDDEHFVYQITNYNNNANRTQRVDYDGPGDDGIWGNTNDDIRYVTRFNSEH